MAKIDIESLTAPETKSLAVECMNMLSVHDKIQVVMATIQGSDRDELKMWLDDEPEEGDEDEEESE
jgi:hypothetical protein